MGVGQGHSSIQITVNTYCHWMQDSQRKARLEVDRLMGPPEDEGCTSDVLPGKGIDFTEKKWGE